MTKSIPLRPTLSIQRIGIIIRNPRKQFLDLMLELFTSERWSLRCIQRETISISIFSLSLSLSLSLSPQSISSIAWIRLTPVE